MSVVHQAFSARSNSVSWAKILKVSKLLFIVVNY